MIEETRIYPECSADTLLIKFIRKLEPPHIEGNSNVAKRMEAKKNKKEH